MKCKFFSKSIFFKHAIYYGISSLIGLIIIVAISVAMGIGLYLYTNNVFNISVPRNTPIEIMLTCYNISYSSNRNGILCFAYNNLNIALPLKIYLENGSIINYDLRPSILNSIGCDKSSNITGWNSCGILKSRIIYVDSTVNNTKIRISILYKDLKPILVK